jgi:hypothetical protein
MPRQHLFAECRQFIERDLTRADAVKLRGIEILRQA